MPTTTTTNHTVSFATSNASKVTEARNILSEYGLAVLPFPGKGVEIQADTVAQVAEHAARSASRRYGRALFVEDAGLFVDSLRGFPGPVSAYVFRTIGIEGLLRLLEITEHPGPRSPPGPSQDSPARSAVFMSAVAYCEPGGEPAVFEGSVKGSIASSPVGTNGFGFDPIFIPNGSERTFGELSAVEKDRISHRGESMRRFALWYSEARVSR